VTDSLEPRALRRDPRLARALQGVGIGWLLLVVLGQARVGVQLSVIGLAVLGVASWELARLVPGRPGRAWRVGAGIAAVGIVAAVADAVRASPAAALVGVAASAAVAVALAPGGLGTAQLLRLAGTQRWRQLVVPVTVAAVAIVGVLGWIVVSADRLTGQSDGMVASIGRTDFRAPPWAVTTLVVLIMASVVLAIRAAIVFHGLRSEIDH